MKKALVIASCALLSTSIFAKDFVDHIAKVKKQPIVHTSSNHVDFSGHWVGFCKQGDERDTSVLDIKHNKNRLKIVHPIPNTPILITAKFVINSVKLDSSNSPKELNDYMSYAGWENENTLSLQYHGIAFIADGENDTFNDRYQADASFAMTLENGKLYIIYDDIDTNSGKGQRTICVHHQEG